MSSAGCHGSSAPKPRRVVGQVSLTQKKKKKKKSTRTLHISAQAEGRMIVPQFDLIVECFLKR